MMEEAPSINSAILSFRFGIIEHNLRQPAVRWTGERWSKPLLAAAVSEGIGLDWRSLISNIREDDHLLVTRRIDTTYSIDRSIVVYTAINFNEFLFTCETICNWRYDLTGSLLVSVAGCRECRGQVVIQRNTNNNSTDQDCPSHYTCSQ